MMRFVDEFRSADKAHALSARIAGLCEPGRQYKLMEVCGGHTHTIYKHGLEDYLPESITLVHGPGCPVCVIPMGRVDDAMALASQPDTIMTSFGDMMRVPGSQGSFQPATPFTPVTTYHPEFPERATQAQCHLCLLPLHLRFGTFHQPA